MASAALNGCAAAHCEHTRSFFMSEISMHRKAQALHPQAFQKVRLQQMQ
jgi:hypothetical protein